jgi:hypothetical protein
MFPHRNIRTYTWDFPDRKTHNHIDYILTGEVYLMSSHSGQQIVTLPNIWWWKKLGTD